MNIVTPSYFVREKKPSHSEGNGTEREVQGSGISFNGGIEIYRPSSYLNFFKAKNSPVGKIPSFRRGMVGM